MEKIVLQWAVIGAGPAGIAAVGQLLDQGVLPKEILWCDPRFQVGDLGQHWHSVSSNTTVQRFLDFLHAATSFNYAQAPCSFAINTLPSESTCLLYQVAEPLQWITDQLQQQIYAVKTTVQAIELSNRVWTLHTPTACYQAKQVILATGAIPNTLEYPSPISIPFTTAMNTAELASHVTSLDQVAVFGSSHSAIIALENLVNANVKRIINFYRSPCRYALDMGDWILFDNTGLKGHAADWAKQHLDGTLPPNLTRYPATEEHINTHLPTCNKVIYATGFSPRRTPRINGYEHARHNPYTGILAPGLFGLGIAYPELKQDPLGNPEYQVGLWKFMVYLKRMLPIWLQYTV